MTDTNIKIIDLIKENKTLREMCKILSISEKQLYVRLKQIINYGYQIDTKYYYGGDIKYEFLSQKNLEENKVKIYMSTSNKTFRSIVISDMHIGNIKSDINLLCKVYEYASKNDIKTILNCGDNIEGDYTHDPLNLKDIYLQIDTLVKKHPYDKNILNYIILGNHDHHSLTSAGLDIAERIKKARYDIVPIGHGFGTVGLKQDNIVMLHKLHDKFAPSVGNDSNLILTGHGHMMKTKAYEKLNICVPSLSYVSPDKTKEVIPGFIDLKIDFEKGKMEFIEAKHMVFIPEICQASESRCRVKKIN